MAITSLQKILNIGHPISFYISDPNQSINTTWTGFAVANPTNQYVNPPSPYTETSGNTADVDNIEKSTGFKDIAIGLETAFLRVPHDGTGENSASVAIGGGFVSSTAPVQQINVTQNQNSIDVDITALLKWYLEKNGGATRMKVLSKGTLNEVQGGATPTPYGYDLVSTPFAETPLPSESYMITQQVVGDVDGTSEIVVDQNRRASVQFYSFGETADQFPRITASYVSNGNMVNTHQYTSTGVSVSVDTPNESLQVTIDRRVPNADRFWRTLRPSIINDDTYTATVAFVTGAVTATTAPISLDSFLEDNNTVVLFFNYFSGQAITINNIATTSITFTVTRTGRNYFNIARFLTSLTTVTGPFGDEVFLNVYQNIDSSSYIYFPQGLTFSSSRFSPNNNETKRFKIKRSFVSGTALRLELQNAFGSVGVSQANQNVVTSTGQFRPKLIVSYTST